MTEPTPEQIAGQQRAEKEREEMCKIVQLEWEIKQKKKKEPKKK